MAVKQGIFLLIKVYFFRLTESILKDRSIRRKNRLPSRRRKNRFHPMHIVVSCATSHAQGLMPMLHTWKDQSIKRYAEMQVVVVIFHWLTMELCTCPIFINFGNHIPMRSDWKDDISNCSCLAITCMFFPERKIIRSLMLESCFQFSLFFFFKLRTSKMFVRNSFAAAALYVTYWTKNWRLCRSQY